MSKGDSQRSDEGLSKTLSPGVRTGVLAARMLEKACRDHDTTHDERLGVYLESVGDLAHSLGRELETLDGDDPGAQRGNLTVEAMLAGAALRTADLANLAACTLPELPGNGSSYLRVSAVVRLAVGATGSIALERRSLGEPGNYEGRDLRGAEWRASLASGQVEAMLQEGA